MRLVKRGALVLLTLPMLWGCTTKSSENIADTDSICGEKVTGDQQIVADNDIAMTVRSITDAINYGETLDSASYSFRGVLTDGRSIPLYTDLQGRPGSWTIEVKAPNLVEIRNLHIGDLFPDALKSYITSAIGINEENLITDKCEDTGEASVDAYDFGRGTITFVTRDTLVDNDTEGSWMCIEVEGKEKA